MPAPPTIIIRHHKEKLAKCSVRRFALRADTAVFTYPVCIDRLPDLAGRILLTLDAPPLSPADADTGLIVLDATWRYADRMARTLHTALAGTIARSIPPSFVTAYPRKQTACPDPDAGLATVEALYIAYAILRRDTAGLLDEYRWADRFLALNAAAFAAIR